MDLSWRFANFIVFKRVRMLCKCLLEFHKRKVSIIRSSTKIMKEEKILNQNKFKSGGSE